VLLLLVTKGARYAVSLSCGFRGGGVPGDLLGIAFEPLVDWFDVADGRVRRRRGQHAGTRLLLHADRVRRAARRARGCGCRSGGGAGVGGRG
jgi:hypothetical protein